MLEHERIMTQECGCRYDAPTGIRTLCEQHSNQQREILMIIAVNVNASPDGDNKVDCQNFERAIKELAQRMAVHGHSNTEALSASVFDENGDLVGGTDVELLE